MPSGLISKKIGADRYVQTLPVHANSPSTSLQLPLLNQCKFLTGIIRWIPTIIISWSIVAGSQAFLKNRASFYAIKALLGLLMGGFIP